MIWSWGRSSLILHHWPARPNLQLLPPPIRKLQSSVLLVSLFFLCLVRSLDH